MELRALGQTGLMVSPIGLGTVKMGRRTGLKLAAPAQIPTDDQALELLRVASTLGVNLVDTAPAYGRSEERLGRLLPETDPPAGAGRWVVFTKAGESFDERTGESRYDFSARSIEQSVERSCKRLGLGVLDGVLLHFGSSSDMDQVELTGGESMAALRRLQSRGLVRSVGASVGTVAGGLLAVERCDVVMVSRSATDVVMTPVIEAAHKRGVGVLLKKALAGGRVPVSTLATLLAEPGIHCAVIGTTNPENLRSACTVAARKV